MYGNIFSALMTLMGLTLAALGFILQGKDRHWIRHSELWAPGKRLAVVTAVVVAVTASISLWRDGLDVRGGSRWWWAETLLFVLSLGLMAALIRSTSRASEPEAVLRKLREKHFSVHPGDAPTKENYSRYIDAYLDEVEELLFSSTVANDLTSYQQVVKELQDISSRSYNLVRSSRQDHFANSDAGFRSLLAQKILGQLGFQFGSRINHRAATSICAKAINVVVANWRNDAAGREVERKGAQVLGVSLEQILSLEKPSGTVTTELVAAVRNILDWIDDEDAERLIAHLTRGVRNASVKGNEDEALLALDAVEEMAGRWPGRAVPHAASILEITVKAEDQPTEVIVRLAGVVGDNIESTRRIDQLRITEWLVSAIRKSTVLPTNKVLQVLESLVPPLLSEIGARGFPTILGWLENADRKTAGLFLREALLNADEKSLENQHQNLQKFLWRLMASFDDEHGSIHEFAKWLATVVSELAEHGDSHRIKLLRRTALWATKKTYQTPEMTPVPETAWIYSACLDGVLRTEDSRLRVDDLGSVSVRFEWLLQKGTLSVDKTGLQEENENGTQDDEPPVELNPLLIQCTASLVNTLNRLDAVDSGENVQAEAQRVYLESVSLLVRNVNLCRPEVQAEILENDSVITAVETAIRREFAEPGSVAVFMDRISSTARHAIGMWNAGTLSRVAGIRWTFIAALCDLAVGSTDHTTPVPDVCRFSLESFRTTADCHSTGSDPHITEDDRLEYRHMASLAMFLSRSLRQKFKGSVTDALSSSWRSSFGSGPISRLTQVEVDACNSILADINIARLPEGAVLTRTELSRRFKSGNLWEFESIARTVNSCLKNDDDGVQFHPQGIYWVIQNSRSEEMEGALTADVLAFEALARDWAELEPARARELLDEASRRAKSALRELRQKEPERRKEIESCLGRMTKLSRSGGGSHHRGQ